MEEQILEQSSGGWSQPRGCRGCGYPMAQRLELCPSCRRPSRLISAATGMRLLKGSRRVGGQVLSFLQVVLALLAGLTVAYYLSPILLLFPLVALCQRPPASRGGKTVSRGRRRAAP